MQEAIIRVRNLQRRFPVKENSFGRAREFVHAVNGIDLDLPRGKTVGLVGESGCGKTTIGRLIVGLDSPDGGEIFFNGAPVASLPGREARDYHKKVQIIFQNPYGALNPRQRIYQTFEEALKVHRIVSIPRWWYTMNRFRRWMSPCSPRSSNC
ncbi:MAG: ATP-binding cassette domain-containing protein [Calditrichia bacterium]